MARSARGMIGIILQGGGFTIVAQLRWEPPPDEGPAAVPIDPLTPEAAPKVRLALTSRFSNRTLVEHVRRYPGMSLVAESGRQYAICGPWRRRAEIAELLELSTGDQRARLVDALAETLLRRGVKLLVLDYGLEAMDSRFFSESGFALVERIVEYERPDLPPGPRPEADLEIRSYRAADRDRVLELERQSFPWLWWNSPAEWDAYLQTRDVEVRVGWLAGQIVAYGSFVVYHRDGHLDRLAVREAEQGHGYGAALLVDALARMRDRGARRVALTTQEDNLRSQALYLRHGFRRTRWTYAIHGKWLDGTAGPAG